MKQFISTWGVMVLLAFVWGSSFILMKRSMYFGELELFSSWQVASIRLSAAFLALSPVLWQNRHLLKSKLFFPLFIVGWFGNGMPAYLFTLAQTQLDSSIVGMMNSLTPLFTFLVGIVIFKAGWRIAQLLGILLGLIGAVYLISLSGVGGGNYGYAFLVVIATFFYAISVNTVRHKLTEISSIKIASMGLALAGIPSLVFLMLSNPLPVLEKEGGSFGLMCAIILGVIGTAGALILFNGLIKRTGALFSSSVTYIIPVFAVMWGIIDGESIGVSHFIAGAILLSGVYLVNRAGPMKILSRP